MNRAKILKVAWLAIALGVGMELILVIASLCLRGAPAWKPVLADTAQKVSWSFFVCVGLALGTAAAKARAAVMGLAGLLAAPAAFHIARMLHKGTLQALDVAVPVAAAGGVPAVSVLVLIKVVEYAWLGTALGWLGKRSATGGGSAGVGLATGLACAVLVTCLRVSGAAKPPVAALVSKGINELLFPMGCSLVLFAAEAAGRSKGAAGDTGR